MRFATFQEAWNYSIANGGFVYHCQGVPEKELPYYVQSVFWDGKVCCEPPLGFSIVAM